MSEDDIFKQTKDAYLCLVHPVRQGDTYRREIASVIALAPSVPDELVASINGSVLDIDIFRFRRPLLKRG